MSLTLIWVFETCLLCLYSLLSAEEKKSKLDFGYLRPKKINSLSQLPLAKKLCAVLFFFFSKNKLCPVRFFFFFLIELAL